MITVDNLSLNELAEQCHAISRAKGYYKQEVTLPGLILRMHSELSEAFRAYQNRNDEHIPEELADFIISILDWCGHEGIDIETAIMRKVATNRDRPYMHGDKRWDIHLIRKVTVKRKHPAESPGCMPNG